MLWLIFAYSVCEQALYINPRGKVYCHLFDSNVKYNKKILVLYLPEEQIGGLLISLVKTFNSISWSMFYSD